MSAVNVYYVLNCRYFGKPGKESFFARYHWLAQQYRKLNLPGQVSEFVFENIDDPTEEYFFSRGDRDIEEELGNVSTSMISEFESIFDGVRRNNRADGESDSDNTEISDLPDSSPRVKRKDSRQFSFDSWPNTPTGAGGWTSNSYRRHEQIPFFRCPSSLFAVFF